MTKKMMDFCISYVQTQSARQSALAVGYAQSFADKRAYQLLHKPEIKEKIQELEDVYYKTQFKKLARKSVAKLNEILSSEETESVQLQASKYALQQAGIGNDYDEQKQTIEVKIRLPRDL